MNSKEDNLGQSREKDVSSEDSEVKQSIETEYRAEYQERLSTEETKQGVKMPETCEDNYLEKRLNEITSAFVELRVNWWEEKRWNEYLYKTRELDCLELPVVNRYLSEWEDDLSFDPNTIFKKCQECLKMINTLEFATAVCPNATEKQLNLWKEGIYNIKSSISKKLDYISFMYLKNANMHLNPKTENMEHAIRSGDDNGSIITICLWANLYRPVRKRGMRILGFGFKLPNDIITDDCAVRLMHTLFNHTSYDVVEDKEELTQETEDMEVCSDIDKTTKDENGIAQTAKDETDKTENAESDAATEDTNETWSTVEEETDVSTLGEETAESNEGDELSERASRVSYVGGDENEISGDFKEENEESVEETDLHDNDNFPPLVEPEVKIVDFGEYFPVGGIFQFDLLVVPTVTVRTKVFTYNYGEVPKLRRIYYKRKIIPPRTTPNNDSEYSFSAYEKMRFQKELIDAIFVQLQLPKTVVFLGPPEPARLYPEKLGYSKDFIFNIRYSEEKRQISFKTNEFGTFAILQRRYENFPYENWILKGGDNVQLQLKGKMLEIVIEISSEGYSVISLFPDKESLISEVSSTFMTTENFVQALLSLGINIEVKQGSDKFADISLKDYELENKVYNCIALLIKRCTFNSVEGITEKYNGKNQIILEVQLEDKEVQQVIICKDNVKNFVQKEEIEEKVEEEDILSEDLETEAASDEQESQENEIDNETEVQDQQVEEEEPVFCDLHQFVTSFMDDKAKE